jgi:hypothetical protein
MAGADMSKNLGGMLSGAAGALGTMGSSYSDSLGRNIENISRPDADPTDIASQESLMQWQNNMGRTDEARNTMLHMQQMQAKRKEEEKKAATEKAAKLSAVLQRIEADPNMTREQKNMAQARIQEGLTGLSGVLGRDTSGVLQGIQKEAAVEQRQADAAQRQQEVHAYNKKVQEDAEIDKQSTSLYYTKTPEEQEGFIADLRKGGQVALAGKLEARYRADTLWAEQRKEQANKDTVANMAVVTAGERKLIDTELDALKLIDPKSYEKFKSQIDSIENDTELTTKMKRQRINERYEGMSRYVMSQTSANMTAVRNAAKDLRKDTELKNPALGLYVSDSPARPAPAMVAVREAMSEGTSWAGNVLRGWRGAEASDEDKAADVVKKWIDGVGEEAAARLAAAIVTTFPSTTLEQALVLAAEKKMGTGGVAATTTTDTTATGNTANTPPPPGMTKEEAAELAELEKRFGPGNTN